MATSTNWIIAYIVLILNSFCKFSNPKGECVVWGELIEVSTEIPRTGIAVYSEVLRHQCDAALGEKNSFVFHIFSLFICRFR